MKTKYENLKDREKKWDTKAWKEKSGGTRRYFTYKKGWMSASRIETWVWMAGNEYNLFKFSHLICSDFGNTYFIFHLLEILLHKVNVTLLYCVTHTIELNFIRTFHPKSEAKTIFSSRRVVGRFDNDFIKVCVFIAHNCFLLCVLFFALIHRDSVWEAKERMRNEHTDMPCNRHQPYSIK